MADLAEKILQEAAEREALYKPIHVQKPLDLEYDAGHLLAIDPNPVNAIKLRESGKDEYLKSLARDNTQLLINKLFQLPLERKEDVLVVKLPPGTTRLPREKPPPKPKPATKWSEFAKQKGIKPRKKEKLVWDEEVKEWVPTYGYKRAAVEKQKNWVVEVPDNKDPNVDYIAKMKTDKKERIAKNEFQRLRNIARNSKVKATKAALPPVPNPDKLHLSNAIKLAKKSTASVGKFAQTLKDEKHVKVRGPKRKFQPNLADLKNERDSQMKVLKELAKKRPKLDATRAANKVIYAEEQVSARMNRSEKKRKGEKSSMKKPRGKKRPW
uniref:Ribosome biogenesis regulatory protein n=1 Tax=Ornithodoros turicata TaxID=34597 RepID=A0A2R5LBY9_9ACAR